MTDNETYVAKSDGWHSLLDGHVVAAGGGTVDQPSMYVGSAWSASGTGSDVVSVVGNMMHRTYESGIPSSFSASRSGTEDYPNGRGCWQSVRSPSNWVNFANGNHDAAVTAYVESIPTDYPIMLTFNHEPENGDDDGNPAHFSAAGARFYDLVKAVRPDIPVGPIYISYTFNTGISSGPYGDPHGWDYKDQSTGVYKHDFIGVDTYQTYLFPPAGSGLKWDTPPHHRLVTARQYADAMGVPVAVGEFACGTYQGPSGTATPDYQMKLDYIQTSVEYVEDAGGMAFFYFNTEVNNDMSPNALLGDDAGTIAYWSGLVATHQAGLSS